VWDLEQVPALSQQFRTITYDQRGIGLSDKPDDDYTSALLAQDALALLQAINALPAHVFGFSTGGQIAQMMCLERPGSVRSLVLAGSNMGSASGGGIPLGLAVGLIEHAYGPGYWMYHLTGSEFPFSSAFRTQHLEKVQALADAIRDRQPPVKMYLRHVLARVNHNTQDRVHELSVPTLVLVGGDDRGAQSVSGDHVEASRRLAARIPGAELKLVEEARHLFAWEAPDETNRLALDFFNRHRGGTRADGGAAEVGARGAR
jgi:pimeloyl-ACP methyl ester carboxylesterase